MENKEQKESRECGWTKQRCSKLDEKGECSVSDVGWWELEEIESDESTESIIKWLYKPIYDEAKKLFDKCKPENQFNDRKVLLAHRFDDCLLKFVEKFLENKKGIKVRKSKNKKAGKTPDVTVETTEGDIVYIENKKVLTDDALGAALWASLLIKGKDEQKSNYYIVYFGIYYGTDTEKNENKVKDRISFIKNKIRIGEKCPLDDTFNLSITKNCFGNKEDVKRFIGMLKGIK